MSDPVADKIAAAKLWLVSERAGDLPYLATALYALALVPAGAVERLAADEQWRLYANPAWVLDSDLSEVGAELAHVTWHLLLDHADRARDVGVDATTSSAWHLAADLTIHQTTGADGIAAESVSAARDRAHQHEGVGRLGDDRSAEEYFALLSGLPATPAGGSGSGEDAAPGCGSACDGVRREHELPPDADVGTVDRIGARELRERVAIDYAGHCTRRGTAPAEAERWARSITEPEVRWEPLLARAVRGGVTWTHGRSEHTWTRPSRRASAVPGVLLPGMRRPVPTIAAVVDTSASVDDHLLGKAMGEVDGALRALGVAGSSITVYACDAAVGAVRRVRRAGEASLVGGGGTDLRVGLQAAADQRPRPGVVIVFTDGYTPWPDRPPPGAAVVVALLSRRGDPTPPVPAWATRVDCVL